MLIKATTVLGLIPASSYTAESERRQILFDTLWITTINIGDGGKTVHIVFKYLSRSLLSKGWGRTE
jgi:hypothetical protein